MGSYFDVKVRMRNLSATGIEGQLAYLPLRRMAVKEKDHLSTLTLPLGLEVCPSVATISRKEDELGTTSQ